MTKTTFSLRNTSIVEQPSKPAISPLSVAYPILPHGRTYEVPSLHLDQDAVHLKVQHPWLNSSESDWYVYLDLQRLSSTSASYHHQIQFLPSVLTWQHPSGLPPSPPLLRKVRSPSFLSHNDTVEQTQTFRPS